MEKRMENVLVIQGARFGDLVQTKRLCQSLSRNAKVHLCVDKSLAELARLMYPRASVHELFFHGEPSPTALEANKKAFGALRECGFKNIYNCNFSSLTTSICRLFAEDKIIGYRPVEHSDGGILRSPWARLAFRLGKTRVCSALNLVDFWAWMAEDPIAPLEVNPPAKGGGKGIGIVLSGRESRRTLPARLMAKIAETIFKIADPPQIKLFGTSAEKKIANDMLRSFSRKMISRTQNLAGKTDWNGLLEELAGLDLLLSPDTGTMHLAATLGVPVMAFFLSSALGHETGPYGKGHLIWQAAPACAPCLESRPCAWNMKCLEPFNDPSFLRSLALYFMNGDFDHCRENLQCWSTDFDDMGIYLRLRAGEDKFSNMRMEVRKMFASWLGIQAEDEENAVIATAGQQNLVNELFPASEWMLPPARYY